MLTIIAARNKGGVFSPSVEIVERDGVRLVYIKNARSLAKLKKRGITRAIVAPSARRLIGAAARGIESESDLAMPALPRILASIERLPLGELFVCTDNPKCAAQIIELCADCARLFTVVSRAEGGEEAFDGLYFNKGIILRRVASLTSQVGTTALCVTENGRTAAGVATVDLRRLSRVRFFGGLPDFVEAELNVPLTAELYAFAEAPLPTKGKISLDYGEKIFRLDTEENLYYNSKVK